MNGSKLYKRLRKEHYLYCQGKKPSILKFVCEYIAAKIEGRDVTQHELFMKTGVYASTAPIRIKEIVKLLGLEEEADWEWKITKL